MKSNWDLTWQNFALLVALTSCLLWCMQLAHKDKMNDRLKGCLQAEIDSLQDEVKQSQTKIDSLGVRDSLLVLTYNQLPKKYEERLITSRTLSNDSLRKLLAN